MSISIDSSTQLAWAIANTEANLAGDDRIRPVHFFLGVLKVCDPQFPRQLQGVELSEDARRQLVKYGKGVRQYLEMTGSEVTQLRRSIRRQLREGRTGRKSVEMLHRSDESRAVFQTAVEKAVQTNCPSVSVTHLMEALFATGSISLDKLKGEKGRPSSRGARWQVVDDARNAQNPVGADWPGRNLTQLAAEGALTPFVGREAELRVLVRVLARTRSRFVAVTGGPGVGKTALVEGAALLLMGKRVPVSLRGIELLELHGSDLAADCGNEAQLSRRLMRLFAILEGRKASVLFIDDFSGLFPVHLKPQAAHSLFTSMLAKSDSPVIVAMGTDEWVHLKRDAPSLARRFHMIELTEPSDADCRGIAEAWAEHAGKSHSTSFTPAAIGAVLKAARALPGDKAMPDRIVDLMESAATFVRVSCLSSKGVPGSVTPDTVNAVMAEHYGLGPVV